MSLWGIKTIFISNCLYIIRCWRFADWAVSKPKTALSPQFESFLRARCVLIAWCQILPSSYLRQTNIKVKRHGVRLLSADGESGARYDLQPWVLGSDLPPLCHWTNVLMLFIGLVHSQSSRPVDGPLGLMGNSIILRGSGLADTGGQSDPTIDWLSPPGPLWFRPPSSVLLVYEILILAAISSRRRGAWWWKGYAVKEKGFWLGFFVCMSKLSVLTAF